MLRSQLFEIRVHPRPSVVRFFSFVGQLVIRFPSVETLEAVKELSEHSLGLLTSCECCFKRTGPKYCRRMKGRLGKAEGITATAHKLARILYTLIASGTSYDESQAFPVKPATQQKQLRQLHSLAKKLGLQVLPNPAVTAS